MLCHLRFFCMKWRGTHGTTEGCGAPRRSIICMNWGSRSKSTNYMSWWPSRSSNGLYWSFTQEIRNVGLSETHASGNREASLTMNDEKPTGGPSTSKKDQDGHGMMSLVVSYTCSSDYSVYDGVCVHTLTCRPHIFLRTARCTASLRTTSCVCTYTHGSKVPKRFFGHVSRLCISPSPASCVTHLCCFRTVTSRPVLTTTSLTIPSTRSCRTFPS